MRTKSIIVGALVITVMLAAGRSMCFAASPQETLSKYVAELRKNPNDDALRERIIRHARGMKPAPALPRDAERYLVRGIAALKAAKSDDDFKDAVNEFEQATLTAPWFANAYYNLGIAQDKASMYAAAIQSLKLYLLSSPDASDSKTVENLIYEIEYRQEKAAKEASPEAKFKAFLKSLDGHKWWWKGDHPNYTYYYELHDEVLTVWTYFKPNMRDRDLLPGKAGTKSKNTTVSLSARDFEYSLDNGISYQGTLSEDGDTITVKYRNPLYNRWETDSYIRNPKID